MTEQTDRIPLRLDVVEARAQAARVATSSGGGWLALVDDRSWDVVERDAPDLPIAVDVGDGDYQGRGALAQHIAAHNPVVTLAQVEDYRQQVQDAEAARARHYWGHSSECPKCWSGRCPDALAAQDRLDRLDRLTVLMVGHTALEVRWREDGNGVWACSCGAVGSGDAYPDRDAVQREWAEHGGKP